MNTLSELSQPPSPEGSSSSKKKSGRQKYVILGAIGIAIVLGASLAIAFWPRGGGDNTNGYQQQTFLDTGWLSASATTQSSSSFTVSGNWDYWYVAVDYNPPSGGFHVGESNVDVTVIATDSGNAIMTLMCQTFAGGSYAVGTFHSNEKVQYFGSFRLSMVCTFLESSRPWTYRVRVTATKQ